MNLMPVLRDAQNRINALPKDSIREGINQVVVILARANDVLLKKSEQTPIKDDGEKIVTPEEIRSSMNRPIIEDER